MDTDLASLQTVAVLAGWEAGLHCPSLGYYDLWASAVGARLTVTIDGQELA